jgi:hypothetical protein
MIPDGLVTYTRNEIERFARDLLRRRPDVRFAPPINLEKLIELSANVTLKLSELQVSHRVEGCVCKEAMSRQLTVIVDTAIHAGPWHRYNSVLGEELAHIHLHGSLFLFVNSIEDFISLQHDPQWPVFERDAKLLSTAIRMPPELVIAAAENAYPKIVDEHGFGDFMKIEKLLRNELAGLFRVSPDDMQRRLMCWPCDIRNRLVNSVQAASDSLIPDSWTVSVQPPVLQRPLFE